MKILKKITSHLSNLINNIFNIVGKENFSLQLNHIEEKKKILVLDLSDLSSDKEIIIHGLNKITFTNSIEINSMKHLGISSGFQNSNNYYKVIVNSDLLENETLDHYVERISNQKNYIRKYPKRIVKHRKHLNFHRFHNH